MAKTVASNKAQLNQFFQQILNTKNLSRAQFNTLIATQVGMSNPESEFAWWVYQNQAIIGLCTYQKLIQNCPFVYGNQHYVDFYLVSKTGQELYVEVKGQMTMYETAVLKYLVNYPLKNFYVFQATSEDWISQHVRYPVTHKKYCSIRNKIRQNIQIQYNELTQAFQNNDLSSLVQIGRKHMDDYIKAMARKIPQWRQIQQALGPIY